MCMMAQVVYGVALTAQPFIHDGLVCVCVCMCVFVCVHVCVCVSVCGWMCMEWPCVHDAWSCHVSCVYGVAFLFVDRGRQSSLPVHRGSSVGRAGGRGQDKTLWTLHRLSGWTVPCHA